MFSAEGAGVESHFHGIQEDFCDDAGVLGVVSYGHQADAFDEQHLGGVALARDEVFDLRLGLTLFPFSSHPRKFSRPCRLFSALALDLFLTRRFLCCSGKRRSAPDDCND